MNSNKFLCALIFLSIASAQAQENFLKGYIITRENDTVAGLIDYREWANSPHGIFFKESEGKEKQHFNASQIQYFYVQKPAELYRSLSTQLVIRPHRNTVQYKTETRLFTGFAHVLIQGELSLYLIKHDDKEYYILQFPDGTLHELVLKRILVDVNGTTIFRDFPVYKDVLEKLENDCKSLDGAAKKTRFSERDFVSFVSAYNACVAGSEGEIRNLNKKSKKHLGLIAGYNSNQYNFSNRYIELDVGNIGAGSFSAGGFMMAYLPRTQGRWGLYYDLVYKHLYIESTNHYYSNFVYYDSENKYLIDLFKGSAIFRHTSISGAVRPFFSSGLTISIPVRGQVNVTYNRSGTDAYQKKVYSVAGEKGVVLGAGIQVNNFEIEVRWERLIYQDAIFVNGLTTNIFLKYHFNRKD